MESIVEIDNRIEEAIGEIEIWMGERWKRDRVGTAARAVEVIAEVHEVVKRKPGGKTLYEIFGEET